MITNGAQIDRKWTGSDRKWLYARVLQVQVASALRFLWIAKGYWNLQISSTKEEYSIWLKTENIAKKFSLMNTIGKSSCVFFLVNYYFDSHELDLRKKIVPMQMLSLSKC